MAKIIKWMKTIGSALLTGAKAVTVAEGMVGNLVAEGIGELFEQGFHSVGEKIKQNQLFKSAESKFEKPALTYGEDFLQELYRDLCKSTGNTQEKKNQARLAKITQNCSFLLWTASTKRRFPRFPVVKN